ncbi:unnamed protein product (macronuclear) [Paramecium tetraurelia]|uniref:Protein kinase domain-containing protein n=1 Tax=Paramecium tetraurelia TaxID=5888 RepID=A0CTK9_PARTE|nr:uncharacterized protein GSPATT00010360001 [Paramecium tetraurelia]CAK74126.1 unnamed protein product [Paramecium tetraurelia]|eukprot:XP_001441523.1 hypothetical protein (macronuclear) [Paramecium tetraurelia strain d4-2]
MQQQRVIFGNKQTLYITSQPYFQGTKYKLFLTSECNYVVKVYDVGQEKYLNTELQAVHLFKDNGCSNIARSYEGELSPNKKVIVFEKAEVLQNILRDSQQGLAEPQVLKILLDLSKALQNCHSLGITHRDIRPENILIGADKQAKLWNFQRCFFQQYDQIPNEYFGRIKEEIEMNTFEHVRAPEQKDFSQRFPITTKVDIYALGQLMYYMIFKVRYDQNPNWEGNAQWGVYSSKLQSLIKQMLIINPKDRISADQIEKYINSILIQYNGLPQQIHLRSQSTNEVFNRDTINQNTEIEKCHSFEFKDLQQPQSSLSTRLVKLVSKVAQKTDFWVAACLEEVDAAPCQKYFRFLHCKAWQKKQKIPKFYEKVSNRLQLNSVIITFKALQLIHNYVKKGPQEAIAVQNQAYSPNAILERIKNFQEQNQMKSSKDKFRTQFFTNLLYMYSIVLLEKVKFHSFYLKFFEGNYAMIPFFNSMNGIQKQKVSIAILNNMMSLWKQLLNFTSNIQFQEQNLINLQLGLAITMADELYNILCTFTHIFYALKQSTNYISGQPTNNSEVKQAFITLQEDYQNNFQQTINFFAVCKRIPQFQQLIPDPSRNIVETLKNVPMFQSKRGDFNITDFLNYSMSIDGIKLPQSYGEIMINQVVEYDEEAVEQEPKYQKSNSYPIKAVVSCQVQQEKANQFNFEFEVTPNINKNMNSQQNIIQEDQTNQFIQQQQVVEIQRESISNKNLEFKKKQTKQQQQGEYKGLDFSDDDDDDESEQLPQKPTELQQKNLRAPLSNQNIQLTQELLNDEGFLNWKPNQDNKIKSNGQSQRIQSANSQSNNIFEQFDLSQNQKQILFDNPVLPQSSSFQVVDYFNKQGKNVSEWMINHDQLKLETLIGTGSSCTVYKGYLRGGEVAIKKMKIQQLNENHLKEFRREISALVTIKRHQNLVQLLGISQKEDELYIVTEYCAGGTLFDLLHRKKHLEISWQLRIKMAIQIADGMLHLHKLNPPLIHRDLKSLNLLLEQSYDQNRINIKIADFGLARVQADNGEQMTGVLGTFHWMAPEVFQNVPYTIKADVYSYAIVLWEICCRETPYKQLSTNPPAIMKLVAVDNGRPDLSLIQVGCPIFMKELMIKCWDKDPTKRPTFQEVSQYLRGFQ